jgi:glucose-1-phosphate cytidylyltransferase
VKVVLFCGGPGTRFAPEEESVPKPMVPIGYRPILWHVMRYYAHFGHKDFVLCLGEKAHTIKDYFLNYNEAMSNDFVLSQGGREVSLSSTDIHDWRITFVDTGAGAGIADRLRAVESHLHQEEIFFANYADVLTDVDLDGYLDRFVTSGKVGGFLAVRPRARFHMATLEGDDAVDVADARSADIWTNGGYYVFRREIFSYLAGGGDLITGPLRRLMDDRALLGYRHVGFWTTLDTFREKEELDSLYARSAAPWVVWKANASSSFVG